MSFDPSPSPPELDRGSRDKVFSIPEICERISRSLDRKTITSCSRVSREWNASWLPILWHTIDAGRQWQHLAFREALGKHGDLIRVLKCATYDNVGLLFSNSSSDSDSNTVLCRNLVTLVLPMTHVKNQSVHVRVLRQNPHLLDLTLSIHDDPSSHYSDLVDAVSELRFLRNLTFDENRTLQVSTLETILTRCNDSLQELSLSFRGTHLKNHPFGSGEEFASGLLASADTAMQSGLQALSTDVEIDTKSTFKIRSLCMDSLGCTQDLLLNLGSRFPLLTRLRLRESVEVYFSTDFPARLAKRCPKLKNIDISLTEDMDDDSIANLISSFPDLQTFRASETRFGNKSLSALVEGCRDLTLLDINSTYGIEGQAIQQLFERCWGLRTLDAYAVSANVAEMMVEANGRRRAVEALDTRRLVSADGMIVRAGSSFHDNQGYWACRGIESLVLRFDYDASTLSEDDRQLFPPSRARRFVYEQLSRLTRLKYLAIGGSLLDGEHDDGDESDFSQGGDEEDEKLQWKKPSEPLENSISGLTLSEGSNGEETGVDGQVQDDTNNSIWIDCSLRSGLSLLSPLKDLHTLCLSADHDVGVPEVKWMNKHWPNLKAIRGLYIDSEEHEEVIEWLKANRPDIELEDDEEDC